MQRLSSETKVGIFVFIGLVLLVYMSMRVGGLTLKGDEGYTLFVKIDNAAGLDKDASVKIAGVEVGTVKGIMLDDHKAKLVLKIKPEVRIGKDFVAVLKTKGLLGEKYLELIPGSPNAPYIEEGGEITRTMTYTDMDKLVNVLTDVAEDVKAVSASLKNVLGGEEGEVTLRNIVNNIEKATYRANSILTRNEDNLATTFENFAELSSTLKDVSASLNLVINENRSNVKEGLENLKNASFKLEKAMESINKLTEDLSPEVKGTVESMRSVAKKIDQGQGTLGKLINEPTTHDKLNKTLEGINAYMEKTERFRMYLGFRGEFLFDAHDTKSYFSLRIQPKKDKYYLLEIVDDPRGHRQTKTVSISPGGTTEITTTRDEIKFSAQIAKRFEDMVLRGGIIESTGGAGIDYYLFKDKLRLTLEAFDFDRERRPHFKAGVTYSLNQYFYVTAGYDDFASRVGLESGYVGVGFHFEDEDIKYLFTSAPPVSF